MSFHVYLVEPPSLLDDLLEDSERVFQHHCAEIQKAFHRRWLITLGEWVANEQIDHPDDKPADVEARVRLALRDYRRALRAKQADLIQEEQRARDQRDHAIRAYVASRQVSSAA